MITLKKLVWSNLFSYGENNEINFDDAAITQLIGANGHGKSSIPLVLEEVLFNKNSKGIKKSDILNRYGNSKQYSISLVFDKDGDEYVINTKRGSTQTVSLHKNGEDISAHTATNTFKIIEDIIGIDHATFCQLVYQSSTSSLGFLTATDTARKKFLIDLLNLTKYSIIHDTVKELVKNANTELIAIDRAKETISSWIAKSSKENLEPMLTPSWDMTLNPKLAEEAAQLQVQIASIANENRRILKNKAQKDLLDKIDSARLTEILEVPEDIPSITAEIAVINTKIIETRGKLANLGNINSKCSECGSTLDVQHKVEEQTRLGKVLKELQESLSPAQERLVKAKKLQLAIDAQNTLKTEFEKLHSNYDPSIPSELLLEDDLKRRLYIIEQEISAYNIAEKKFRQEKELVDSHNMKVQLLLSRLDEMRTEMLVREEEHSTQSKVLGNLQTLQKAFSTSGIVAYKIENLIKDLENLTNHYLLELSDGRFQLTFKINNDKLNVVIGDNGNDIDITALSSGERNRVNTATLLAIRKLMQSLSKTKINLLVLDEVLENLDIDGKEKLVEVLLEEEHLNTFLISHSFSHPLLDKLFIVKENNISRIERN